MKILNILPILTVSLNVGFAADERIPDSKPEFTAPAASVIATPTSFVAGTPAVVQAVPVSSPPFFGSFLGAPALPFPQPFFGGHLAAPVVQHPLLAHLVPAGAVFAPAAAPLFHPGIAPAVHHGKKKKPLKVAPFIGGKFRVTYRPDRWDIAKRSTKRISLESCLKNLFGNARSITMPHGRDNNAPTAKQVFSKLTATTFLPKIAQAAVSCHPLRRYTYSHVAIIKAILNRAAEINVLFTPAIGAFLKDTARLGTYKFANPGKFDAIIDAQTVGIGVAAAPAPVALPLAAEAESVNDDATGPSAGTKRRRG